MRGEHTFPGEPGVRRRRPRSTSCAAWVRTATVHAVARLKTRRRRVELVDAGGQEGRPRSSTTRSRCSTTAGSPAASASSRSSSARTRRSSSPTRSSRGCRRPAPASPDPTPKIVRALGMRAVAPPDVVAAGRPRRATRRRATSCRRRSRRRCSACSPTTPACGSATTPRRCTRRGSRPGGCAPTSGRSRSLLDPEWDEALRDELKWLGAELGAVRDTEVLLELLRAQGRRASTEADRPIGEQLARPARATAGSDATRRAARRRCARTGTPRCSTGSSTPRASPALLPAADAPAIEVLPPLAREARGRSCGATSRRCPRTRPTSSCTRSGSGPSAAGTPPRPSRPALGPGRTAVRQGRRRAPGRARRPPGRGRRDHVAPRTSPRTPTPRTRSSSPGCSPGCSGAIERETRAAWPAAWQAARGGAGSSPRRRRATTSSAPPAACSGVARRRTATSRSCSCTGRATTTGACPRASATRASPTRTARAGRCYEETGHHASSSATELPDVRYEDHKGRPKVVRYWVMRPRREPDPFVPERRGRRDRLAARSTTP